MKVGLCVATHNSARYLEKCLRSIKDQTYRDVKLVCVDDASSDDTGIVLDYYNVEYLTLGRNSGSCAKPYNIGLSYLSTDCELLMKVDSDDYLEPTCVEEMVASIGTKDFVQCYLNIFEPGKATEVHQILPGMTPESMREHNMLNAFGMMTSNMWEMLGGFREDLHFEDWEFWIRALRSGFTYNVVPRALYNYRKHAGQETNKVDFTAARNLIHNLHYNHE